MTSKTKKMLFIGAGAFVLVLVILGGSAGATESGYLGTGGGGRRRREERESPAPSPLVEPGRVVVFFGHDSKDISYASRQAVTTFVMTNPEASYAVEGHSSSDGSRSYNLDLSRERAARVADIIETAGIGEDQLLVTGAGIDEPMGDNSTPDGRALNRRVEVVRVEGEE